MLKTVITWRIWFKVSIPGRNDKRFLMLFFSFRESEDRQEATEAVIEGFQDRFITDGEFQSCALASAFFMLPVLCSWFPGS